MCVRLVKEFAELEVDRLLRESKSVGLDLPCVALWCLASTPCCAAPLGVGCIIIALVQTIALHREGSTLDSLAVFADVFASKAPKKLVLITAANAGEKDGNILVVGNLLSRFYPLYQAILNSTHTHAHARTLPHRAR